MARALYIERRRRILTIEKRLILPLFLLLSGALDTVNAVYVNKKQAADFYQSAGLQLPMEGRRFNDLFGSSIKTDADFVKAKLENPERYFAEDQ